MKSVWIVLLCLLGAAVLMALVMVVLIALLFKAEDIFGKDVEG